MARRKAVSFSGAIVRLRPRISGNPMLQARSRHLSQRGAAPPAPSSRQLFLFCSAGSRVTSCCRCVHETFGSLKLHRLRPNAGLTRTSERETAQSERTQLRSAALAHTCGKKVKLLKCNKKQHTTGLTL